MTQICIQCSEVAAIEIHSEWYCDSCGNENFVICSHCDDYVNIDYCCESGDDIYCERCYASTHFRCHQCSEMYLIEYSFVGHDGYYYCEDCYSERYSSNSIVIHDCSYVPDLTFYAEKWEKTVYLGFELEVEGDFDFSDDFIREFDESQTYLWLKEDGSLEGGFEIVSHPHTLQRHKKCKWDVALKWLEDRDFTSYDNERCGLHVHVNKDALTELNWMKVKAFFWTNRGVIQKFSGRTDEQVDDYCRFSQQLFRISENRIIVIEDFDRYHAVNFKNNNTVEFRIFRGTLNFKRFMASLEFCDALITFVQQVGVSHTMSTDSMKSFLDFSLLNNYDYLYRELQKCVL